MDPYAGLPVCLLLAASFVAVGDGEALSSFFFEIHGAFLADFHGELWWRSCKVLGGVLTTSWGHTRATALRSLWGSLADRVGSLGKVLQNALRRLTKSL